MLVSIVVVNYNGKEFLKKTLDSIYRQNFKSYELIVVDNASTDSSVEFIRKNYPNVIIVQNNKNQGYVGINSALGFCNGRYIVFLNNDIKLEINCLKELIKAAKSTGAAMLAPKIVNFYDKSLKSGGTWVSRAFYSGHIKGDGNEKIREIPYMGIGMIDRVVTDMFGYLFDNDYFIYAEDLDLGLRLRLLGLKVIFVPKAVIYHMHSATMVKTKDYKRTYLMERNLLMTFIKIFSLKGILTHLPYITAVRVIAVSKDFITLRFMNGFARIFAAFWVITHIRQVLKKRKGLQNSRKMSDKFVLEVFSERELFRFSQFAV